MENKENFINISEFQINEYLELILKAKQNKPLRDTSERK